MIKSFKGYSNKHKKDKQIPNCFFRYLFQHQSFFLNIYSNTKFLHRRLFKQQVPFSTSIRSPSSLFDICSNFPNKKGSMSAKVPPAECHTQKAIAGALISCRGSSIFHFTGTLLSHVHSSFSSPGGESPRHRKGRGRCTRSLTPDART